MLKYRVCVEERMGGHLAYGLEVVAEDGTVLEALTELFAEREPAERLAAICNNEGVELVHMQDVAANAVAEYRERG